MSSRLVVFDPDTLYRGIMLRYLLFHKTHVHSFLEFSVSLTETLKRGRQTQQHGRDAKRQLSPGCPFALGAFQPEPHSYTSDKARSFQLHKKGKTIT